MIMTPKLLTMVLVILCVCVLVSYTDNVCSAKEETYEGKVKKVELGEKPKTGKITIATEAGDMTFIQLK